jgi:hypothetical protein
VFDKLLSAPTDHAVRAHQHRTARAYTIDSWPPSIDIHQVTASADTPYDQPNTQPVSHLQRGIAPRGAIRACQQHEVLTEQIAGTQPFAVALQKHMWGAGAGVSACDVQLLRLPSAGFTAGCCQALHIVLTRHDDLLHR